MTTEFDSALTGAAFELANAGYRSMPDPEEKDEGEEIGSDSASLREAAERLSAPRDEVIVRKYTDGDGKPVAPNEAVSLERAGRDYARVTAADRLLAENETSQALVVRVDALRAEALAKDPDAADFYGFEPPQAKTERAEREDSESEASEREPAEANGDPTPGELDPEIEKALRHPQVRPGHRAADRRGGKDPAELSRRARGGDPDCPGKLSRPVSRTGQYRARASARSARTDVAARPGKVRSGSGHGSDH